MDVLLLITHEGAYFAFPLISSICTRDFAYSIYDLAELLGVSYDTLNNYLCTARLEMLTAIERDFDILPKETQNLIKKLLE